jgi:hypothetical protein
MPQRVKIGTADERTAESGSVEEGGCDGRDSTRGPANHQRNEADPSRLLTVIRDLLTAFALVLSVLAFLNSRRLDKRDLFLKMHENLLGELPMAGSRALGHIHDEASAILAVRDQEGSTAIYRALAGFDVLGLYVERGWVNERTVLEEWADSLSKYATPKRLWVEQRYPNKQFHSWPHDDDLADRASGFLAGTYRPSRIRSAWRRARGRLSPAALARR